MSKRYVRSTGDYQPWKSGIENGQYVVRDKAKMCVAVIPQITVEQRPDWSAANARMMENAPAMHKLLMEIRKHIHAAEAGEEPTVIFGELMVSSIDMVVDDINGVVEADNEAI